jgi:hypothetical protein
VLEGKPSSLEEISLRPVHFSVYFVYFLFQIFLFLVTTTQQQQPVPSLPLTTATPRVPSIPKDPEQKRVIDKTAETVVKVGPQIEDVIKEKQKGLFLYKLLQSKLYKNLFSLILTIVFLR